MDEPSIPVFPPVIRVSSQGPYASIGGWLILVAIGLTLFIVRGIFEILLNFVPLMTSPEWSLMTSPDSRQYQPYLWTIVIAELLANISLIAFAAVSLKFMLNRSKRFPKMQITLLLANLAFLLVDLWLARKVSGASDAITLESIREVSMSFVAATIWVPYFLMSKRVKETFVK